MLREVEGGAKVQEVVRSLGITKTTIYRGESKYSGAEVSDVKRSTGLEQENRKLKALVADPTLDMQTLQHLLGR